MINELENGKKDLNALKIICEILPSYDLASNNIADYPKCYKNQMKKFILSLLLNIKYNKEINGQKLLDVINAFIQKTKTIKNIKNAHNIYNDINGIVSELFKEKVNAIYLNIIDKINKFDKNIINLNGKNDLIKNYLIDEIKNELNNTYELYDDLIHNEICNILEINALKTNSAINERFNKVKNEINEEIILINDITKNNQLIELLSKFHYKEEINTNEINNIIEQEKNKLLSKYELFFECIDNNYKQKIIEFLKNSLSNNINSLIKEKPKWEEVLNEFISGIEINIINKFKNQLIEEQAFRIIKRHL
jgi:hypothetical protein